MQFAFGQSATVGRRNYQEDASDAAFLNPTDFTLINDPTRLNGRVVLTVLADGMGGHVGGAEASALACTTFRDHVLHNADPEHEAIADTMLAALHAGNQAIADRVKADPQLAGMGCTLVGAIFNQHGVAWTSVGDSLLYQYRKGHLYRLNADHSLQPVLDDLVKRGEMTADEARRHPQRNALRSALTGQTIELTDQSDDAHPLQPGDWVVVASDGLLTLSYAQIADTIRSHSSAGPQTVAQKLIAAVEAADRPNQDNTTIVCVQVSEPPVSSARADRNRAAARQALSPRRRFVRRSPATIGAALALGIASIALAYVLWTLIPLPTKSPVKPFDVTTEPPEDPRRATSTDRARSGTETTPAAPRDGPKAGEGGAQNVGAPVNRPQLPARKPDVDTKPPAGASKPQDGKPQSVPNPLVPAESGSGQTGSGQTGTGRTGPKAVGQTDAVTTPKGAGSDEVNRGEADGAPDTKTDTAPEESDAQADGGSGTGEAAEDKKPQANQ